MRMVICENGYLRDVQCLGFGIDGALGETLPRSLVDWCLRILSELFPWVRPVC